MHQHRLLNELPLTWVDTDNVSHRKKHVTSTKSVQFEVMDLCIMQFVLLQNWISYGWSYTDREMDTFHYNMYGFCGITLGLVLTGFLLMYIPDYQWVRCPSTPLRRLF